MVTTYIPNDLQEALAIKDAEHDVIVLAGGTDLMVRYHGDQGLLPRFENSVLFIGQLATLQQIEKRGNMLSIGAACRLRDLLEHPDVPEIIKKAVREMASPAVRNRGTIGGNICNASPAGDTLPPLYALGASMLIKNFAQSREVPIHSFIMGPGKVDLRQNELLIAIQIPLDTYNVLLYKKVGARKADAISKLSFVGMAKTADLMIEDVRIAFGAVGPRVVRAPELERLLIGKSIAKAREVFLLVKDGYSTLIQPIDDQRSNRKYRKTVSLNLLENFLTEYIKPGSGME